MKRNAYLKWHRRLSLVLMIQLAVWLITAFGMSLIPSSSLRSYANLAPDSFDAAASWPSIDTLREAAGPAARVETGNYRIGPTLTIVRQDEPEVLRLSLEDLKPVRELTADDAWRIARDITGENLSDDDISLKTRHTPEYPKLSLPAWRAEASRAVLFIDPETGDLLAQTNATQKLETLLKSIHVMDYSGTAQYKDSKLLTVFASLFFGVAVLGVLPVRRVHAIKGTGWLSLRWHQLLGLALALQVFLWVTSGLSVVWVLDRAVNAAEDVSVTKSEPIDWAQVLMHPTDIVGNDDPPTKVALKSLFGEPVYEFAWSPDNARISFIASVTDQSLHSAVDGRAIALDENARNAIAKGALAGNVFDSISRWTVSAKPTEEFFAGPFPVWLAHIEDPLSGYIAIDQTTGHVHSPIRSTGQVLLAEFYKAHVVYYQGGVIRYRREPVLLTVIGLMMVFLTTGVWIHIRRWRARRKPIASSGERPSQQASVQV